MDKENTLRIELETLCFRLGNANEAIELWADAVAEEVECAAVSKELAAAVASRMRSSYLPSFEVIVECLRSVHSVLQAELFAPAEP